MSAPVHSKLQQHPVIAQIRAKLDERSMPILRQTVGSVVSQASRVQTNVGDLAQTILQDQSFSARVLSVANGVYFRNRVEPITTVTRAIMQIGYNTIRDFAVAAEFVDMAQARLPSGVNLQAPLAKALVAAYQAKALAEAMRLPEAEGVFTTSQLQNIGTLALALYMPREFKKIQALLSSEGLNYETACRQVLDLSPEELAEGVLDACRLPPELLVRAPDWTTSDAWDLDTRREAVVAFANEVADNLFVKHTAESGARFSALISSAAGAFGLPVDRLNHLLTEGFSKASSLGKSLGLGAEHFSPRVQAADDPLDEGVHQLVQHCTEFVQTLEERKLEPVPDADPDSIGSASLLVNFLKDLTDQISTSLDFNSVVSCVLEGLHRAVGFDHAIVLFLVPGKSLAVGRYGVGPDAPNLLSNFVVPTDSENDLLAHCMATRTAMRFSASDELPFPLPPGLMDAIQPSSIALGPLHLPARTVGLIWADRMTGDIEDTMWNSFQLFHMQANLALLRLSTAA